MVYAGVDEWCVEIYAVFFDLFYAGADLSGAAFHERDFVSVYGAGGVDCGDLSGGKFVVDEGTTKTGCARRLARKEFLSQQNTLTKKFYSFVRQICAGHKFAVRWLRLA